MTAGYSGTALYKKLGIDQGTKIISINHPNNFRDLLGAFENKITITRSLSNNARYIHYFTQSEPELKKMFPELKKSLAIDGSLWISWPKKTSKLESNLDENIIREIGLENGLVDVKVTAIDDDWSALKFVFRTKDRK
jgi:hypothetical protein